MAEKTKPAPAVKHIPKDAQVIMSIMRDMDINEYEPRVINQLLEFTYRYVAVILEDAKTYANHAKKKSIDLKDVKLALKIQLEQSFTSPPPRDLLTEVARAKNSIPLPLVKPHCGIRLPPDRHCLSSCNLKIKQPVVPKKNPKALGNAGKLMPKANIGVVKRTGSLPIVSRTQTVTIPKPVVKVKPVAKPRINIQQSTSQSTPIIIDDVDSTSALKRKREEDEFDMNM